MELLHIAIVSLASAVALFILTKITGKKEMSQLNMFDFVSGITIGSIAAEMATALEDDYRKPLVAMIVYALLSIFISLLSTKSIVLRRFLYGKSLILLENGEINNQNLKKARLDINEFLTQCRNGGYFDLENLQTVILEPSGKLSFLPKSTQRPVTPNDLNLIPPEDKPLINVIIDGKILAGNLEYTGNNKKWLDKQLHDQGITKLSDVFLATCNNKNNLNIYVKLKESMTRDIFE